MRKAAMRAGKKMRSDENKAPKVIRGRARQPPPVEATLKRKPPEIGLHASRVEGLFDGDNGVIEPESLPPTLGNGETDEMDFKTIHSIID